MLILACAPLRAGWRVENDYISGSNGFKKDSVSVIVGISTSTVLAPGVSFYKDRGKYRDAVYSLRLPVAYSNGNYLFSFKPFFYPERAGLRASAEGAKIYAMTGLGESSEAGYLHLTVSGAAARQKTGLNIDGTRTRGTFSQNAFEVQLEKSFYNQFFFLASAAGFTKPDGTNPATAILVLDQSELAYLGTFRSITSLPEWVMALQFMRSMEPDFNSHLYAGFSRIALRRADPGNSTVFGMKMRLNEGASLDLAYNFYKQNSAAGKNYFRIFIQMFFR